MKTITIPNILQIRLDYYGDEDMEINSIEELDKILRPLRIYKIWKTYNYVASEWSYYNETEVTKETLLKFVAKNQEYQEDFQKYYDEIIEKDKVISGQPFEHPGYWIIKQWLEENG